MQIFCLQVACLTRKQQICSNGSRSIRQIGIFMGAVVEQLYDYTAREVDGHIELQVACTHKQRPLLLIFAWLMVVQN